MNEHFDKTGICSLCEAKVDELLIDKPTQFFSIVPFAATYPFEIWIVPQDHSHFPKLDCEKASDLGLLLKLMLRKMSTPLNNPPCSFMFLHRSRLKEFNSTLFEYLIATDDSESKEEKQTNGGT